MKPIEETKSYAEVSKAMVLEAKQNPRSKETCFQEVMEEINEKENFIYQCFYTVVTKDSLHTGLSVRLAEVLAKHYRNLNVMSHVQSYDNNMINVHGIAHDLETNHMVQIEVVKPYIFKGFKYSESQMNGAISAATSIAKRQAIFSIIPRWIQDTIREELDAILQQEYTHDEGFFLGIAQDRISALTPSQLAGIKFAVENEGVELREFFPLTKEEEAKDALQRLLNLGENGEED